MGDGHWFRRGRRQSSSKPRAGKPKRRLGSIVERMQRTLTLEPLEDRRMLVAYLVTSPLDIVMNRVQFGSLRWAVNQANATEEADQIVFADSVTAIGLNGGQLSITQPLQILGPGPRRLTVSQTRPNQRVFDTNIGSEDEFFSVEISGLTISGGNLSGTGDERRGAGVFNREALTMNEVVFDGNSASMGGGGIYVERGSLRMNRSLMMNNSSNVGGAIMEGSDADDVFPNVTINDSTITGNTAFGGGKEEYPVGYGGGVFMRNGRLTINSSTIVGNSAGEMGLGGGVAVWGAPYPDDFMEGDPPPDPPPPSATVYSSILVDNMSNDIDSVGMTDDDPPMPLLTRVASGGFNIIGMAGMLVTPSTDDLAATDPEFVDVDGDGQYDLADFGGSTDVFMISDTSPALDAGGPDINTQFDVRGSHFTRFFDYTGAGGPPAVDVGAVERQQGSFVVDELFDEPETEGQTAGVYQLVDPLLGTISILGYDAPGDFTLREAMAFARKNSDPSVISFSSALRTREFDNDPQSTPSPATLKLTLGVLGISTPMVIAGPTTFILEIDASGNDPTPDINDGKGTRVFQIDDGDLTNLIDVQLSNLTIMGGDITQSLGGGAMLSRENTTIIDSTFKDNYSSNNGGALSVRAGTMTVSGTTFSHNTASLNGGAIQIDSAVGAPVTEFTLSNSTVSTNDAGANGGGLVNNNADVTIEYSTFTLNTAQGTRGGGVYVLNGADAKTEIKGTILSGNQLGNDVGTAANAETKITSLGYNLVGKGNAKARFNATGDVVDVLDPKLGPLIATGGQTETHQPLTGSPVIDAGDPAAANAPMFDQRGPDFVRVFDGDLDGAARIDIGAYELQSSTFVVSTAQDENNGNYSSGNLSLREAIILANANPLPDIITFDPMVVERSPAFSLSAGTLTVNDTADMHITAPLEIQGPGSTLLSLDGSGLTHPLFPLQGSHRIFTIDDGNSQSNITVKISGLELLNTVSAGAGGAILSLEDLTLDDIALTNNQTIGAGSSEASLVAGGQGGAVYQEGASLTVTNSVLTGNKTNGQDADGGAIFARNASVTIDNTRIGGNTTLGGSSEGGGLALKNSTLLATGVTISNNSTTLGLSDGGGGFLDSSTAVFEDTTISGNFTTGSNSRGGGLAIVGASSQVGIEKDTTISNNHTEGSGAVGGGAFVGGGTLSVNNSTVVKNSTTGQNASGGGVAVGLGGTLQMTSTGVTLNVANGPSSHGGGVANLSGNATIRNSTLSANQAKSTSGKGGGLFSDTNLLNSQTTTILNSTISGNSAGTRGGGVFNADGRTDIKHSTITNNSTPYYMAGNGVGSQGNTSTITSVQSSIIAGNGGASGTGTDVDFLDAPFFNSFQSLGFNVIGSGNAKAKFNAGGDKTGIVNPLLGPLSDNGGTTQTHALLSGSPAINAGNPAFNPNNFAPALTTDQRGAGFARVLGSRIDIGAFESSLSPFTADFDLDGDVDGADFMAWQRGNGIASGATQAKGDANGDGKVNGADLTLLKAQFGSVGSEAAEAAAVVSGGEESEVAAAAMAPTDAEAPAGDGHRAADLSGSAGALAGAGLPGNGAASQAGHHHRANRSTAAHDVVHAFRGASLAAGPSMAGGGGTQAKRADATAHGCDADLSDEDAVFALLGEGLL